MTAVMNLLFSLPDAVMSEVFAFDNTHHGIFSSLNFKNELRNEWLQMQTNFAKIEVIDTINTWMVDENDSDFGFENEYLFIGHPTVIRNIKRGVPDTPYHPNKMYLTSCDDTMVYFTPRHGEVSLFKVLPKEFINKPKDFFQKLKFDGIISHPHNQISAPSYNEVTELCNTYFSGTYMGEYDEVENIETPDMYRNVSLWI